MRMLALVSVGVLLSSQAKPSAPVVYSMGYVLPNANAGVEGWVPLVFSNGTHKTKTGSYVPKSSLKAFLESDEPAVQVEGVLVRPPPAAHRSSEGWQKLMWGASLAEVEAFSNAKAEVTSPESITRVRWKTKVADADVDVVALLFGGRLAGIDLFPSRGTPEAWRELLSKKYGPGIDSKDLRSKLWLTAETAINARVVVTDPVVMRISYASTLLDTFLSPAIEAEKKRQAQDL